MYSAHIQGSQTIMTAAVYEGDGAEEKWRDEISQYSKLRHPNLFQLYGIVNSAVHAAIFYDGEHLSLSLCQATDPSPVMLLELVPCKYLLQMYRNLHFSTVFFWACMETDSERLGWSEYSVWIRSSTGSLCLDLTRPQSDPVPLYPIDGVQAHRPRTSVLELPEDSEIISSMSLAEYHRTCNMYLCQWREVSVSTNVPAKLGSILHICGPRYEDSVEIAYCAPVCGIDDMGWSAKHPILEDKLFGYGWMSLLYLKGTVIMENGWVRINSADVADIYYRRLEYNISGVSWLSWLTQANHIFDRLHITSHFDDYVFVEAVKCWVHILGSPRTLPAGYLFLCSLDEFQAEVPTWFRRPLCPAYWSLEPFGAHRLSAEESRRQGFPEIILRMEVFGRTWDEEVYTGIRQFQEMKGFDPSNREVAVELGCSLFQVSCPADALLAHMEGSDSSAYTSDGSAGAGDTNDHFESADNGSAADSPEVHVNSRLGSTEVANVFDDIEGLPDFEVFLYFPTVPSATSVEEASAFDDFDGKMLVTGSWYIVMSVKFALIFIASVLL
ncbi:hypothetical protein C8J57DRAFT_1480491, partial [Mycena rebaudengoi]